MDRELKRISWNVVARLILLLRYNHRIKKTTISMKCSMSYDKCVLYVGWMENMGFIKREIDEDGFELISLSDKGEDLYQTKLKTLNI